MLLELFYVVVVAVVTGLLTDRQHLSLNERANQASKKKKQKQRRTAKIDSFRLAT